MAWPLPPAPGTASSRFGTEDGSREGKSSGSTAHSPSPRKQHRHAEHNRNAYLPLQLVSRHRSLVGVSQSERERRGRGGGAGEQEHTHTPALLSTTKHTQQFPALCRLKDLQNTVHYISGLYGTAQTPCIFLQTPLPMLAPILQRTSHPLPLSPI